MKEHAQIKGSTYNLAKVFVEFECTRLQSGGVVIYTRTNVAGYCTPSIQIDLMLFRIHRKRMRRIGYVKFGSSTQFFYHPQKFSA